MFNVLIRNAPAEIYNSCRVHSRFLVKGLRRCSQVSSIKARRNNTQLVARLQEILKTQTMLRKDFI